MSKTKKTTTKHGLPLGIRRPHVLKSERGTNAGKQGGIYWCPTCGGGHPSSSGKPYNFKAPFGTGYRTAMEQLPKVCPKGHKMPQKPYFV